jgi:hypothetical protein
MSIRSDGSTIRLDSSNYGGQDPSVVVLCSPSRGTVTDKLVRQIMSTTSQEILDSHGIWVVGIPQKTSVIKSGSVAGARMHAHETR